MKQHQLQNGQDEPDNNNGVDHFGRLGNKESSEVIYLSESAITLKVFDYETSIKDIKLIITSIKRSLSGFKENTENYFSLFNRVQILYNTIDETACTELLKRELSVRQYELLENIIKATSTILREKRYAF